MIGRRGFLGGLAGIFAAGVAPAIVKEPMKIWVPPKRKIESIYTLDFVSDPGFSLPNLGADFDGDTVTSHEVRAASTELERLIRATHVRTSNAAVQSLLEADKSMRYYNTGIRLPPVRHIRLGNGRMT